MYAKDLIEILQRLPKDTLICETSGETGCADLNSAKYFPQYDILYLDPFWARKSRGFIDMADGDSMYFGGHPGSPHCPFSKEDLREIRDLAKKGKEIVDAKKDGKKHRIQVVNKRGVVMPCQDIALRVDDEWISGDFRLGRTEVVCDFEWESLGN